MFDSPHPPHVLERLLDSAQAAAFVQTIKLPESTHCDYFFHAPKPHRRSALIVSELETIPRNRARPHGGSPDRLV